MMRKLFLLLCMFVLSAGCEWFMDKDPEKQVQQPEPQQTDESTVPPAVQAVECEHSYPLAQTAEQLQAECLAAAAWPSLGVETEARPYVDSAVAETCVTSLTEDRRLAVEKERVEAVHALEDRLCQLGRALDGLKEDASGLSNDEQLKAHSAVLRELGQIQTALPKVEQHMRLGHAGIDPAVVAPAVINFGVANVAGFGDWLAGAPRFKAVLDKKPEDFPCDGDGPDCKPFQQAVEQAKKGVEQAEKRFKTAKTEFDKAQKGLADARTPLEDAKRGYATAAKRMLGLFENFAKINSSIATTGPNTTNLPGSIGLGPEGFSGPFVINFETDQSSIDTLLKALRSDSLRDARKTLRKFHKKLTTAQEAHAKATEAFKKEMQEVTAATAGVVTARAALAVARAKLAKCLGLRQAWLEHCDRLEEAVKEGIGKGKEAVDEAEEDLETGKGVGQLPEDGGDAKKDLDEAKKKFKQAEEELRKKKLQEAKKWIDEGIKLATGASAAAVECSPNGRTEKRYGEWEQSVVDLKGYGKVEILDYKYGDKWRSSIDNACQEMWGAIDNLSTISDIATIPYGNLATAATKVSAALAAAAIAEKVTEYSYGKYQSGMAAKAIEKLKEYDDILKKLVKVQALKIKLSEGWTGKMTVKTRTVDTYQCVNNRWQHYSSGNDPSKPTIKCDGTLPDIEKTVSLLNYGGGDVFLSPVHKGSCVNDFLAEWLRSQKLLPVACK